VDGTAGHVLRFEGRTVPGYYASSHGGASESGAFVFGIDRPYLRSVDDSRWDLASDNPSRTWSVAFSADELGSKLGVGKATKIDLPEPRGVQGRVGDPRRGYGGVRVEGTNGTVTLSGEAFKSVLRLRSTLFQASGPPAPPPPPPG
jgi:stage II sporulation protein D